jgi:hypothetical protein
MRFNAQDKEALRILGFTIAINRDADVATLEGEMKIVIIRATKGDRLSIATTLPGGGEITAIARSGRGLLIQTKRPPSPRQ